MDFFFVAKLWKFSPSKKEEKGVILDITLCIWKLKELVVDIYCKHIISYTSQVQIP
jgi:hypothetical protein